MRLPGHPGGERRECHFCASSSATQNPAPVGRGGRPARRAGVRSCSVPHPGEPHSPVPLLSASSLDLGRRAAELSPARRLASHTATEHTRPGWDLLFIYRFCKL